MPSRDRRKVVLQESEAVSSSESDEVDILSPHMSIHVYDFKVEGEVNQSIAQLQTDTTIEQCCDELLRL